MIILERPLIFFDLETTGTNINVDHIVEIAIIKLLPTGESETKTMRINPLMPIPKAASDVHGITNEMVKDCPTFRKISIGLLTYIKDCDIAGFNSNAFDVPLLYNEFNRVGITWDYSNVNFIDVGNIFKRKNERTLSAAYKHYCGEDLENAHSAEADIIATMEVFKAQLVKHGDLPQTISELAKYSNFDKDMIDLGGCFSKDADGDFIFNFGKNKGLKCRHDLSYLNWMLNQNFLPDAKNIIKTIINKQTIKT